MGEGKVYIVGSGPGDPKLFTLKGVEAVKKAQVLLYDYLAPDILLNYADDTCEKIYVGKSAEKHTKPQNEINELIKTKALEGKIVVRLKGGDPFVFGRGGEEVELLKDTGIPFEIVPGITASIAGPAYAGIPVTHRDYTQTFTLVTGHEAADKEKGRIPWKALAELGGTIAFYMGVKNLRSNLDKLIEYGTNKDTPAAFIRWATKPTQKTFTGTVGDLDKKVPYECLKPPAMIIVGEVVKLRETVKWFEDRPLFGKTILVTRARTQASSVVSTLSDLGANCIELPTIRIEEPESYNDLDGAIYKIESFDWIIFTSVNGVEHFKSRLGKNGKDARCLSGIKLGSIGPATKNALFEFGIKSDFMPSKYDTESILKEISDKYDLKNKKILLPRADIAPKELEEGLSKLGAVVKNVTAYRTLDADEKRLDVKKLIDEGEIDCLTFSSSSTVKNFFKWYGAKTFKGKKKIVVASIGPVTTNTLKEYGKTPDIKAGEATIPSLVDAIKKYYE